jgi:hypothetical protein
MRFRKKRYSAYDPLKYAEWVSTIQVLEWDVRTDEVRKVMKWELRTLQRIITMTWRLLCWTRAWERCCDELPMNSSGWMMGEQPWLLH